MHITAWHAAITFGVMGYVIFIFLGVMLVRAFSSGNEDEELSHKPLECDKKRDNN